MTKTDKILVFVGAFTLMWAIVVFAYFIGLKHSHRVVEEHVHPYPVYAESPALRQQNAAPREHIRLEEM